MIASKDKNLKKKVITIVCYANFCRSPVIKKILESKTSKFIFDSAGIIQHTSNSMDLRSAKYLREIGLDRIDHIPKKISQNDIMKSDLIIAVDNIVYISLLKQVKNREVLKMFSMFPETEDISDPIKFDEAKYLNEMKKINNNCDFWAFKLNSIINLK